MPVHDIASAHRETVRYMYALLYNKQATGLEFLFRHRIRYVGFERRSSDLHCKVSTEPRPHWIADKASFQIISSMSLPGQTIGVVIDIFIVHAPSDTPLIFQRRVNQRSKPRLTRHRLRAPLQVGVRVANRPGDSVEGEAL